ncbi:hypothetical protein QBC46DRAFT_344823 [Diplogelasinospora grovesii]|uniref:Uncharacterized protein n=1 Tax=Diplogelasinospora grovesii TaxID=303347 RepID=A0AAN6S2A5_9PEZI|nr:hypothetical protein QBC46DRAFT_344823 [Diplogelasinospora grovesii]
MTTVYDSKNWHSYSTHTSRPFQGDILFHSSDFLKNEEKRFGQWIASPLVSPEALYNFVALAIDARQYVLDRPDKWKSHVKEATPFMRAVDSFVEVIEERYLDNISTHTNAYLARIPGYYKPKCEKDPKCEEDPECEEDRMMGKFSIAHRRVAEEADTRLPEEEAAYRKREGKKASSQEPTTTSIWEQPEPPQKWTPIMPVTGWEKNFYLTWMGNTFHADGGHVERGTARAYPLDFYPRLRQLCRQDTQRKYCKFVFKMHWSSLANLAHMRYSGSLARNWSLSVSGPVSLSTASHTRSSGELPGRSSP